MNNNTTTAESIRSLKRRNGLGPPPGHKAPKRASAKTAKPKATKKTADAAASVADPAAATFMAGKLMACKTLKVLSELPNAGNGGPESIWADFLSDTQYTEQANPVADDIEALVNRPDLIDGYGAALTHAIAALFDIDDGVEMAEGIARAPYEACRTDRRFKDGTAGDGEGNFAAPTLYEQLAIAPPALARVGGKSRVRVEAAPGAKFAEALALLPDFIEKVRNVTVGSSDKADWATINALMAGLEPILETGTFLFLEGDLELHADQIGVLLYMLDESIPAAARQAPLFQDVERSIDKIRGLISGYRSLGDASIAAPAADMEPWRAHALQALTEVDNLIYAANEIGTCGLLCNRILRFAGPELEELKGDVTNPDHTPHCAIDWFYDLQALLAGVAAVEDAPRGTKIMMLQAVKLLDEAIEVFDNASIAAAHKSADAPAP